MRRLYRLVSLCGIGYVDCVDYIGYIDYVPYVGYVDCMLGRLSR